jgi:hypothetical protein
LETGATVSRLQGNLRAVYSKDKQEVHSNMHILSAREDSWKIRNLRSLWSLKTTHMEHREYAALHDRMAKSYSICKRT